MFAIAYKSGTGRSLAYPQIFETQNDAEMFLRLEKIAGHTWPDVCHVVEWDGKLKVSYPDIAVERAEKQEGS